MVRFPRFLLAPVLSLALCSIAAAQPWAETAAASGKAACALTFHAGLAGVAFRIHSSGYYLVWYPGSAEAAKDIPMELVLEPALPTQRSALVSALRWDKALELALVHLPERQKLAALSLGSSSQLAEAMELVTFKSVATPARAGAPDAHPAFGHMVCKITALKRNNGELQEFEIEPPCEHAGAPVLDRTGKVVGISTGQLNKSNARRSTVIPIDRVIPFLARPELQFTPPVLTRGNLHQPAEFQVRARTAWPLTSPLTGELILKSGQNQTTSALQLTEGVYKARVIPAAPANKGVTGIDYTVVMKLEGKEVGRLTGTLSIGTGTGGQALVEIKPAPLTKDKVVVMLPGPVADLAVGGGGRYLVLYIPEWHKLAIFDANTAKIQKYLDAPGEGFTFAAGRNALVTYLPEQRKLERWSLSTFEREASVPAPFEGSVVSMTMGSASDGPLLLQTLIIRRNNNRQISSKFFDVQSMKLTALGAAQIGNIAASTERPHVYASADGRTFSIEGQTTVVLKGDMVSVHHGHNVLSRYGAPSHDGKIIFTSNGPLTQELKLPGGKDGTARRRMGSSTFLPAQSRNFYFVVEPARRAQRAASEDNAVVAVHLMGTPEPILSIPDLSVFRSEIGREGPLAAEKHYHLIPDAELFVYIPLSCKDLVLHRVKVEEALAKSSIDFFFVNSDPPTWAKKGTTYTYRIVVKSKKGGIKYELRSGPQGMAVSDTGVVTWPVPSDMVEKKAEAVVGILSSGQERLHKIALDIE